MKELKMSIMILILVLMVGFPFHSSAQEDEVTTTESVQVVNVEVPVRVFHKGSAVDGLTRENFQVFEDGKPQEINGFYIRRKKLATSGTPAGATEQKINMRSRYFVLVFKIIDYNEPLRKGLKYLFENVFRESDQCLVFINDKSIFFKNLDQMDQVQVVMHRILREESQKARQRMQKYLTKVEDEVKLLRFRFEIVPMTSEYTLEVWRFLHRYLEIWNDYNKIYLKPDLDNYFYFSRHLEKIKKEKWVVNFYQIEKFPKLKQTGPIMERIRTMLSDFQAMDDAEYSTMIKALSRLLRHIDIEMHATRNFPADEISKLFMKVDATFHSILIPVNRQVFFEDIEYKEVSSEIESSLREITKQTGGSLQRTGNLESALEKSRKGKISPIC